VYVCVCVCVCVCRQTAYAVVDDVHAVLPDLARDQYWDELEIQLPYTLATHQTRRDEYQATADNIELVACGNSYWVFTRSDRRTDRSVRLVCPTGRSDDRIV